MNIIVVLLPLALLLALIFVVAFIWAAGRGQYDDLETPAHKMLLDDSIGMERNRK
ncbi:MAG: cbb3-type cytochrome oxidase assembly protein CcoS [Deltaproteobacteria bacterium]|nr:cbb3-type cytochrome oxidase assembly protein CcoS [Deltaproteobacteria bacterium]